MPFYFYFILTLVLELPVVLLFFKRQWKLALLTGFLLNLFTWPLLHVLLYHTQININLLELGVAITEGTGYCLLLQCRWYKGFGVGLLVNAFSYGVGLFLNNFIG
ncbi:MAG: hypothetical protein ABJA78_09035 [Ferruginibacter sp.]